VSGRRAIQAGDAVMFLNEMDEPIPAMGVWIAREVEAEDADGVARVLLRRVTGSEERRFVAARLWVTDTAEERLANLLMRRDGE